MQQKYVIIGISVHAFILFVAVSMVIEKSVSPEKDHFNLKHYVSTSTRRTLSV